ncbi:MAG TPA: hypothetical protein VMR33_01000 [Candidatus Baltobacteraceae bacterium]|jgi:hypothetical protein|nr:hypothetical protein [Candidatus Baltobacteraceae bacterium]
MRSRIFFAAIVSFWLVMNFLLWRSQWGAHSRIGNAVPVEVVWDKILTAPDNSSLEIYDHDRKIGNCHWLANVGNSPLSENKNISDDYSPDTTPTPITQYTLNFDGNSLLPGSNRIRFDLSLTLSTNHAWQDFRLSVRMRPTTWDLRATAATQEVVIKVQDNGGSWQKTLKFSDLRDPEALMGDLGGAPVLGLLAGAAPLFQMNALSQAASGVQWQAHEDWIQFGHSKARAYRLETEILGQHFYVFVSRVGEILWVEFPNKITLRNDAFSHF